MGTVASSTSARADRLALMARLLAEQGTITTTAIGAELGVSTMTARRDVDELVRQGLAYRTHGGAVAAGTTLPPPPDLAADAPSEAEEGVAAAALATIASGETIFLDAGRMSHLVARGIVAQGLAVTIVTNSLPAMLLTAGGAGEPAAKLFGLGGHFVRAWAFPVTIPSTPSMRRPSCAWWHSTSAAAGGSCASATRSPTPPSTRGGARAG